MNAIGWSILGVVLLGGFMLMGGGCSVLNRENSVRQDILATQKATFSDFDAMKKIISQQAQGVELGWDKLEEILKTHAEARTPGNGSGAVMTWVQESIPNIDQSALKQLMSSIEVQLSRFNNAQKALIDKEREHRTMFGNYPGCIVLSIVGRKPLEDVQIVTSKMTKQAFATGEDNDTELFKRNKPTQLEK